MLSARLRSPLCRSCRDHLLSVFIRGFDGTVLSTQPSTRSTRSVPSTLRRSRYLHTTGVRPSEAQSHGQTLAPTSPDTISPGRAARLARQAFRDKLPEGLLNDEQYAMYKRMYGEPQKQDQDTSEGSEVDVPLSDPRKKSRLLQENRDGQYEEVDYVDNILDIPEDLDHMTDGDQGQIIIRKGPITADMKLQHDIERIMSTQEKPKIALQEEEMDEEFDGEEEQDGEAEENDEDDIEEDAWMADQTSKAHPLTESGRFGTDPSTLSLPKSTFVEPIASLLADSSRVHLREIALRALGGHGLPLSPATPGGDKPRHKPLGLQASHREMGKIEADVFLAAVMPPIYASISSVLVEVRKKLGSSWLNELFQRDGGPRILEHGGAGAGILAANHILKAEWKSLHESDPNTPPIPSINSSTVVASNNLRYRVSRFLDNTAFLPRLPDYVHTTNAVPPVTKQFDIVIAAHTIWPIGEDHMRRAYISNLWSLTNPNGGILILIEKGWPRGFEAIAAARQQLLEKFIPCEEGDNVVHKDPASIIAPCTNHAKCPMYLMPGTNKGRKDVCHFEQRYIRPPFLQNILGESSRNHEDVAFSYLTVRRGRDHRQDIPDFLQGETAAEAAFRGLSSPREAQLPGGLPEDACLALDLPSPLTFPRTILPPLKRRGHVILDLCTPAGNIERWTVPRSYSKIAYRDARKSRWGDLWALGAKTRVPRRIRLGTARPRKEDILVETKKSKTRGTRGQSFREAQAPSEERKETRRDRRGRIADARGSEEDDG